MPVRVLCQVEQRDIRPKTRGKVGDLRLGISGQEMGLHLCQIVYAEGHPEALLPHRAFSVGGKIKTVYPDPMGWQGLVQGLYHGAVLTAAEPMADYGYLVLPIPVVPAGNPVAVPADHPFLLHGVPSSFFLEVWLPPLWHSFLRPSRDPLWQELTLSPGYDMIIPDKLPMVSLGFL